MEQNMSQLQIVGTKPSEPISQSSRSYAAAVAEILIKAMAGSPSVLTGDEFKFVIVAWTEVLEGCVPESRLNDCYLHAKRNRKSTFPLDVSELCTAWHELRAKEAERQNRV